MGIRSLTPIAILFSTLAFSQLSFAGNVEIDVTLSPAGSYKAKTQKINGTAYKTPDGGVAAEGIAIDLRSLQTGISLRDKHTKEHLMTDKYPQAKLVKASGKDGKGTATIEIRGKTIEVAGTYKVEGGNLKAQFPVNLSAIDVNNVRYMGVGVKDTVNVNIDVPLSEGAPNRAAASTGKAKKK